MIHPFLLAIVVDHVLTSVVLFVRPLLLAVQVQLVQPVPQELQAEDDQHHLPGCLKMERSQILLVKMSPYGLDRF